MLTDDTGVQSIGGIQADSLGENSQISFNTNADREAVMRELDEGGPIFSHDANIPQPAAKDVTTAANDMSHYESEEIDLVGNAKYKNVKGKPVRLPSLTTEGSHSGNVKIILQKLGLPSSLGL